MYRLYQPGILTENWSVKETMINFFMVSGIVRLKLGLELPVRGFQFGTIL